MGDEPEPERLVGPAVPGGAPEEVGEVPEELVQQREVVEERRAPGPRALQGREPLPGAPLAGLGLGDVAVVLVVRERTPGVEPGVAVPLALGLGDQYVQRPGLLVGALPLPGLTLQPGEHLLAQRLGVREQPVGELPHAGLQVVGPVVAPAVLGVRDAVPSVGAAHVVEHALAPGPRVPAREDRRGRAAGAAEQPARELLLLPTGERGLGILGDRRAGLLDPRRRDPRALDGDGDVLGGVVGRDGDDPLAGVDALHARAVEPVDRVGFGGVEPSQHVGPEVARGDEPLQVRAGVLLVHGVVYDPAQRRDVPVAPIARGPDARRLELALGRRHRAPLGPDDFEQAPYVGHRGRVNPVRPGTLRLALLVGVPPGGVAPRRDLTVPRPLELAPPGALAGLLELPPGELVEHPVEQVPLQRAVALGVQGEDCRVLWPELAGEHAGEDPAVAADPVSVPDEDGGYTALPDPPPERVHAGAVPGLPGVAGVGVRPGHLVPQGVGPCLKVRDLPRNREVLARLLLRRDPRVDERLGLRHFSPPVHG